MDQVHCMNIVAIVSYWSMTPFCFNCKHELSKSRYLVLAEVIYVLEITWLGSVFAHSRALLIRNRRQNRSMQVR